MHEGKRMFLSHGSKSISGKRGGDTSQPWITLSDLGQKARNHRLAVSRVSLLPPAQPGDWLCVLEAPGDVLTLAGPFSTAWWASNSGSTQRAEYHRYCKNKLKFSGWSDEELSGKSWYRCVWVRGTLWGHEWCSVGAATTHLWWVA